MSIGTKRATLWLALLMMLSLVLAACGNDGGDGDTPAGTTPTAGGGIVGTSTEIAEPEGTMPGVGATAPVDAEGTAPVGVAPSGPVAAPPPCPEAARDQEVQMWSPLTGPDGQVMTRLATQFSEENEYGITVRHTAQPEYLQRLNTSAAAKKLPTMTVIRAGDIPTMAARNILKPISDEAMGAIAEGDISGDFPEQVWAAGEYNDGRYAFPLDVHPLVMYYNKDLFKQAGIPEPGSEPMTKEDFEAAVAKLHQGDTIGWAIGTLFSSDTMWQMLTRQLGGTLANEDGTQATYNSAEGAEALQYVKDMKAKYSPKISGTGDPEVVAFQQGKVGVVFHGPWHISNLEKLPFTGFAPVPQLGDEYAVWGGSHQLGITTEDPAQQAAAGCWIGWLSSNSAQWAKAGLLPIRNSVRNSEELTEIAPNIAAFAAEADAVILFPPVPDLEAAVMTEASKAIAAAVAGKGEPKQLLDQAAQRSNQIIQQNQKKYGGQ